jgi:hypothetical protein
MCYMMSQYALWLRMIYALLYIVHCVRKRAWLLISKLPATPLPLCYQQPVHMHMQPVSSNHYMALLPA